MKIKTRIKVGGVWTNHSETLVRGLAESNTRVWNGEIQSAEN
jgi:hypothetical protein